MPTVQTNHRVLGFSRCVTLYRKPRNLTQHHLRLTVCKSGWVRWLSLRRRPRCQLAAVSPGTRILFVPACCVVMGCFVPVVHSTHQQYLGRVQEKGRAQACPQDVHHCPFPRMALGLEVVSEPHPGPMDTPSPVP